MNFLKLIFAFFLLAGTITAQQVNRNKVVIEGGTGTW
jgi:hypothetical protein